MIVNMHIDTQEIIATENRNEVGMSIGNIEKAIWVFQICGTYYIHTKYTLHIL